MPVGWILHILLLEILDRAPYEQFDKYSWNPGSLTLMVGRFDLERGVHFGLLGQ